MMEAFKTLVKQAQQAKTPRTSFTNWNDLLEAFNKFNPNDGNSYMLTTGKGTPEEARSRFLTHVEALNLIRTKALEASQMEMLHHGER